MVFKPKPLLINAEVSKLIIWRLSNVIFKITVKTDLTMADFFQKNNK